MSTPYLCHNCKQSGHIKRYCPLLLLGTRTSIHSTIGGVPSASIPDSMSHSSLASNKNGVIESSLAESTLNKIQTSICTSEVLPIFLHSACVSSNICSQRSSSSFLTNHQSKHDAAQTSRTRSVPRFSPYHIPYHHSRRGPLSETGAEIPRGDLILVTQLISGVPWGSSRAFSNFVERSWLSNQSIIEKTRKHSTKPVNTDITLERHSPLTHPIYVNPVTASCYNFESCAQYKYMFVFSLHFLSLCIGAFLKDVQ